MGFKIVYKNDRPPYGTVYDYHEPKFAMVAQKGTIFVQQLTNLGTHPVILEPLVLGEGFYISTYSPWGGKPKAKAYFYVDEHGDVLEFDSRAHLQRAFANLQERRSDWHQHGRWVRSNGEEPVKRKIARDPLTRFDRIDRDIVPDLKSPAVPEKPKKKATDDFTQALNDAMKTDPATKDPMKGLVDDFLDNL